MEEVIVPSPKTSSISSNAISLLTEVKYATDRLDDLYPKTLWMPVTAWAGGLGEEYPVVVPAGTGKEDLQQIVEDGMQIHNRNYVQSIELVK